MNAIRLMAASLALYTTLLAADDQARKVVEVKYTSANTIKSLLNNFGVNIAADDRLKVVVLSGPTERVTEAEAAVRKLDVQPPHEKNIELLAYLVMASNEPQTGPEPADMAAAIKQMRTLFPYKSYRLLETIWVRSKAGGGKFESSGLAPASFASPNFVPVYQLSASGNWVSDSENTILFSDLTFVLTLGPNKNIRLSSNVEVHPGQKVVIGKTNPTGADSAVVLVVTAKAVD